MCLEGQAPRQPVSDDRVTDSCQSRQRTTIVDRCESGLRVHTDRLMRQRCLVNSQPGFERDRSTGRSQKRVTRPEPPDALPVLTQAHLRGRQRPRVAQDRYGPIESASGSAPEPRRTEPTSSGHQPHRMSTSAPSSAPIPPASLSHGLLTAGQYRRLNNEMARCGGQIGDTQPRRAGGPGHGPRSPTTGAASFAPRGGARRSSR